MENRVGVAAGVDVGQEVCHRLGRGACPVDTELVEELRVDVRPKIAREADDRAGHLGEVKGCREVDDQRLGTGVDRDVD